MESERTSSKGLLTPGTSLVLLEAQAATGFIIDPVNNKKLSVEEAAAQGVIGHDWKKKLLSAERAVTGYTDPHTDKTISLFQKGEFYFFVDEATKLILKSTTTTRAGGKYQGKTVSLWDLLYSKYITEEERRELVQQYKSGAINIERFMEIILTTIQQ
uniref:Uncharacterized protein n=1 Tax=Gadus morhua TaxID=8049 RepID=A0A8C5FPM9_GADMO